ncbi:hypothetical protein CRV03_02560 [Arcobacter sp. F155]|uniref:hypothetical protein n=1 Tax=Arcobacter sp. F155 TaxID=2044512 RepID=UPI00100B247C|nr:hypothetical protein [Arcobacter sp. F155]RXJ77872.1 hypothetical protein CRV03_02560 [Arcobacter sp. F155]
MQIEDINRYLEVNKDNLNINEDSNLSYVEKVQLKVYLASLEMKKHFTKKIDVELEPIPNEVEENKSSKKPIGINKKHRLL